MIKLKEKIKNTIKGLILDSKSFFMQEYFRNIIVIWLLILNLVANLANWIILKLLIQSVNFPIILHYNVYFGVDLRGNYRQIFVIPIIGLFLFSVNFILAKYVYTKGERIACYLLLMATLMMQVNLIIYSLSIILINY